MTTAKDGWIHTLRAQVLLGIALAPLAFALVALPWGSIKLAGAPDPDRETTGTVVGNASGGRSTCVKVVEYAVDGRTFRTETNKSSMGYCDLESGEEVVHYEADDPSEAYAGEISTEQEGRWLFSSGLGGLAIAAVLGLLPALDRLVFGLRRRRRRKGPL